MNKVEKNILNINAHVMIFRCHIFRPIYWTVVFADEHFPLFPYFFRFDLYKPKW
jgi:hypothetical protein